MLVLRRGGICHCRHCRRQCKILVSGVNFSIFTHFFCVFITKTVEIDGVNVLAWKSGGVKFLTNSMSGPPASVDAPKNLIMHQCKSTQVKVKMHCGVNHALNRLNLYNAFSKPSIFQNAHCTPSAMLCFYNCSPICILLTQSFDLQHKCIWLQSTPSILFSFTMRNISIE